MEEAVVRMIESLFYKKIMLYNDLLGSLNAERESLISIDLDNLWHISKEKDEICAQINTTRQEIVAAAFPQETQKQPLPNRYPSFLANPWPISILAIKTR